MPTKFNMTKDVAGYNGFGLVPSADHQAGLLATSTAQSITVPSEYPTYLAVFSFNAGGNVWCDYTTTATVPAGAFAADTSELNPSARLLAKGTTISMITGDAAGGYASVAFYVAGEYVN